MVGEILPAVHKFDDSNGVVLDFINDEVRANGMHTDLTASNHSEWRHFRVSGNQVDRIAQPLNV